MAAVEALTEVLLRGRERFNLRFARSRADGEVFKQLLRDAVAPLADAVWRVQREKVDGVVAAAYDILLDLLGDGVIDHHPLVADAWKRVLPAMPWLLAEQPREVIASITNAMVNVSSARWIDLMEALAPEARDLGTLRALGHVAAWRCGMAQHREGALASCATLPAALGLKALGTSGDLAQILERLRADRWLTPERAALPPTRRELRVVRAVSGFRGFGGAFLTPPLVANVGGMLVARDREGSWFITADVFGEYVGRVSPPAKPRDPETPKPTLSAFPEFADSTSAAACDDGTVAVTVDRSHSVFLIALQ